MVVRRIFSRNADFQLLSALRENRQQRNRQGVFLVEGVRNINGATERGWTVRALIYSPEQALSQWAQERIASTPVETHYHLSAELLGELSGKTVHTGSKHWRKLTRKFRKLMTLPDYPPEFALTEFNPQQPVIIHLSINSTMSGVEIYQL